MIADLFSHHLVPFAFFHMNIRFLSWQNAALASLTVPQWLSITGMAPPHGAWAGQGMAGSSISCFTSPGVDDARCMLLLMAVAPGDLQHLLKGR